MHVMIYKWQLNFFKNGEVELFDMQSVCFLHLKIRYIGTYTYIRSLNQMLFLEKNKVRFCGHKPARLFLSYVLLLGGANNHHLPISIYRHHKSLLV